MRDCPRCAARTEDSAQFCPECGTAFVRTGATVDPVAATGAISEADAAAAAAAAAADAAASLVGITLGEQFVVESLLGGGAFGTVYRGRQLGLDREVAIKVPTHTIASDPVMAKRFAREAKSAAKIVHPGVVAIYAVGELDDGRPYLVMQFVEGEPLDKILEGGPVAPLRALKIIRALASALTDTHAADVVHRDLKPTNIMWRRDRNGDDRLTIVDFGIAASKPGNADATRLTTGGLIGTPHYMSPEQAHGEQVDARSDLYALGCLLFELVTGAPPFEGSGFEVLLAHLGRPAPAPSERNPDVPEVVDRLCARLLEKKPDDRPPSADAVVALVDDAIAELSGNASASAAGTRPRVARARRKTGSTQFDRPKATDLVPSRPAPSHSRATRRLVVGATVATLALVGAGFAAWNLHTRGAAAAVADAADDTDEPTGSNAGFDARREMRADDGEVIVMVSTRDPVLQSVSRATWIEVKNKLGAPIIAPELVVTVVDDTGAARGLAAHPSTKVAGRYTFKYSFPRAGRYLLRVFPPSIDSSFEFPIDVR